MADIRKLEEDLATKSEAVTVLNEMTQTRYRELVEAGASEPFPPDLIELVSATNDAIKAAEQAKKAVDQEYRDREASLPPARQSFSSRADAEQWAERLDGDQWNAMTKLLRLQSELSSLPDPLVEKKPQELTEADIDTIFNRLAILDDMVATEHSLRSIDASLVQAFRVLEEDDGSAQA